MLTTIAALLPLLAPATPFQSGHRLTDPVNRQAVIEQLMIEKRTETWLITRLGGFNSHARHH